VIFIGIGFAVGAVNPAGLPRAPLDLSLLGPELVELSPAGFLGLGVLLMILTPVARVLLSILAYVHAGPDLRRDHGPRVRDPPRRHDHRPRMNL